MPDSMKVARLYTFDDIRIEDIPIPEVGQQNALIKTAACGVCSGDVMPWYIEKKAPLVLGHEPAGEIAELGSKYVGSLRKGDRVFVHHHAPCLTCEYCLRGDYVQCATWRKTGIIPGGVSEYIMVPGTNLNNDTLVLPSGITFEDGTLVEPAACVVKSLRRSLIKKGHTVLIIGLGVMGQMHVLLAREFGAERIIGVDMVPFRLQKALEFGCDHIIDVSREDLVDRVQSITKGMMANTVIVGPNSVEAMKQGLTTVARGGTVLLFTPAKPGELLTLDPEEIYFKDIRIAASYSCGPDDTRGALLYIQKGVITADKLVTHRFPIDQTEKAYRLTSEAKTSLKSLIVF